MKLMERFKNLFGRKSKEAALTPEQIHRRDMNTEMLRVVQQLRVFIYDHNLPTRLAKNLNQCEWRETLMRMLHESVLTDLDPDYTWYEKEISFDNGYEVTVMCKQGVTHGNPEKLFEVAVYKLGEICYDGHSDVHGHLSFEDVGELLHKIRNLPPAEKNGAEQEEANPYEVPTGPTSGVMTSGIVARVGPQLPSFRFNATDLVWYIGDNTIWPHSDMAVPDRVQLKVVKQVRLFNANGDFVGNAYWIKAKRARAGYFVSPTANLSGASWQFFQNIPERVLSDTYLPPLTLEEEERESKKRRVV